MLTHIKRGPYLPWRTRAVAKALHDRWQEAARLAREPIIHTATDENCPAHAVVSHGYGVDTAPPTETKGGA